MYELSITNTTADPGKRERRFIPVYDGAEYGMYDLVTDDYFGNAGTGAFGGNI